MEIFAEKLKRLRNQKSLSQSQLAEKIYVSRSAVAKWEQGRGFPSVDSLQIIASEFCVTIDDLVSDKEVEILKIQKDKKLSLRTKLLISVSVILALIMAIGTVLAVMYYPRKLSKYLDIDVAEVDAVYLQYFVHSPESENFGKLEKIKLEEERLTLFIDYVKKIEIVPRYKKIKLAPLYEFVIVSKNTSYYFSYFELTVFENDIFAKNNMYNITSGSDNNLLVLFNFNKNDLLIK